MTRPPVTLSREMKILLTALGLVALLGGWLVMNNRQQADTTVAPPPVTAGQTPNAATNNGTDGNANPAANPAGGTSGSTGEAGISGSAGNPNTTVAPPASGTQVASDGKTEIATVPPFPVTDPNGSTPDPTVVAAVPRGINPDQPLNNLNGSNPFSPIRIEANGTTPAGALASTPPASTNTSAGPVTITRPTATPSQIDSALNSSGALPLPTIAGAETASRPSTSNNAGSSTPTTSGALPVPTIPGIPAGNNVTVIGASGQPSTGPSTSSGPTSGNAPSTTVNVPSAVRPPIAGVRVPSSVNVPNSSTSAEAGAQGAAVNSNDLSTPPVMTELGAAGDAAQTTLDSAIKEHNLVFDAAVLGPVNTAVFRSDKGYVVATVGQTIPNTNITLQEVTASTATLAAGNDKRILELDKR